MSTHRVPSSSGSPIAPSHRTQRAARSLPALMVTLGTFSAPLAQWVVFFLVARVGGSGDAGRLALMLAVATPVVTAANWGLRNGYITLHRRSPFIDFVTLRVIGVLIASVVLMGFGVCAGLDPGMVVAVTVMKAADSMADIWYGRWQHQQRLRPLGAAMIANGVFTVLLAAVAVAMGLSSVWIVAASAFGSILTFLGVLVVDTPAIAARIRSGGSSRGPVGSSRQLAWIVQECWQISVAQILAGLVVSVPTWAIGLLGSTEDVGRFAAAGYMITVGSLIGSSMNAVVIGKYRADAVSGGRRAVQRAASRTNLVVTAVGILGVGLVGVVGVPVFEAVYGSQFVFTTGELVVVALAAALNPGTFVVNAALLATNSYRRQLSIVAIALLGTLVAAGALGVAHAPGLLIGGVSALAGSLLKYGLSALSLGRIGAAGPARLA